MQQSARDELVSVARDMLSHHEAGTLRLAPDIMGVATSTYTDEQRFSREREHVFHNLPLMLAMSCELRDAGSYKTMEVAGTPVLLVRGRDGKARAFLNSCTHRGAILAEGCGAAARFTCPYHGWTFNREGDLVGVALPRLFGEIDRGELGLKSFPVLETAGMIWVILNPASTLDIASFLGGYGAMLEEFRFAEWTLVNRPDLPGPNWKLCFDAHLEFYHLPVLHRETFGAQIDPRALYYNYGPHQRLARPERNRAAPDGLDIFEIKDRPPGEWPTESLMFGEWIIFPNISINTFYAGGRGVILSQIIPGRTVGESTTIQLYLMERDPAAADRETALETAAFLAHVVGDEDLPMSDGQQKVLRSGGIEQVYFGRNEGGLQHFHRWVDRVVETPVPALADLFPVGEPLNDAARGKDPLSVAAS